MQQKVKDPTKASTVEAVERFSDALNRHDVDAVMAAMTEDCVFEHAFPAPDGHRFKGQADVRGAWELLLTAAPKLTFDVEEIFAVGDRCVLRWTFRSGDASAQPERVRGVDVFRVRDGKVAEKLSYVKG